MISWFARAVAFILNLQLRPTLRFSHLCRVLLSPRIAIVLALELRSDRRIRRPPVKRVVTRCFRGQWRRHPSGSVGRFLA
jgi:hypothetical protein